MLVYVSPGLAEVSGHAGEPAEREIEGRKRASATPPLQPHNRWTLLV